MAGLQIYFKTQGSWNTVKQVVHIRCTIGEQNAVGRYPLFVIRYRLVVLAGSICLESTTHLPKSHTPRLTING